MTRHSKSMNILITWLLLWTFSAISCARRPANESNNMNMLSSGLQAFGSISSASATSADQKESSSCTCVCILLTRFFCAFNELMIYPSGFSLNNIVTFGTLGCEPDRTSALATLFFPVTIEALLYRMTPVGAFGSA